MSVTSESPKSSYPMRRFQWLVLCGMLITISACKNSDNSVGPTTGPYAIYNFDSVKFSMYVPTLVRHAAAITDSLGHIDSNARVDSVGSAINIPTLFFKT